MFVCLFVCFLEGSLVAWSSHEWQAELELEDSGISLLSVPPWAGLSKKESSRISEGTVIMAFDNAVEIHTPQGVEEDIYKTEKAKCHSKNSVQQRDTHSKTFSWDQISLSLKFYLEAVLNYYLAF